LEKSLEVETGRWPVAVLCHYKDQVGVPVVIYASEGKGKALEYLGFEGDFCHPVDVLCCFCTIRLIDRTRYI
jgi:hypothetical protein